MGPAGSRAGRTGWWPPKSAGMRRRWPATERRTQNWYPLSAIPMYRDLIDGLVADLEVGRVVRPGLGQSRTCCSMTPPCPDHPGLPQNLENSTLFDDQLGRWRTKGPDDVQRREIKRLSHQVARSRTLCRAILDAAAAMRNHPIGAILHPPDEESGLWWEVIEELPWMRSLAIAVTVDSGEDEGAPMVMWRRDHVGFLGTATLQRGRDGGVEARMSVADKGVSRSPGGRAGGGPRPPGTGLHGGYGRAGPRLAGRSWLGAGTDRRRPRRRPALLPRPRLMCSRAPGQPLPGRPAAAAAGTAPARRSALTGHSWPRALRSCRGALRSRWGRSPAGGGGVSNGRSGGGQGPRP